MGLFNLLFGNSQSSSTSTSADQLLRASNITIVCLVCEESVVAQLPTHDMEQVAAYAISATRQLAGPNWPAIEQWMRETRQMVSLLQMGGNWDNARLVDVVRNQFGQLSQFRSSKQFITKSGTVQNGNIGLVVAIK